VLHIALLDCSILHGSAALVHFQHAHRASDTTHALVPAVAT